MRLAKEEIPLVAGAFTAAGLEKEQSLFWVKPERLSSLGAADRDAFAARLSDLLASNVRPAVASLMTYLTGEYMAKALDAVGLAQYLGGNGYYRALVRRTTLPGATPEEIHKIGLEAIDRLNTELDAVRKKVGFAGSLAEFRQHLKTDARFFARTPEEVGERLMAAQNWILPKIPEFFGKIPKASFGVQRPEPQLEGALTFGYYQTPTARDPKGYYKDNGSNLKERSLLGAGSSSSPAITSRSTCSTRLRACRSSGASPSTPL